MDSRTKTDPSNSSLTFSIHALEAAARIALAGLLAYWCFLILRPFLVPVIWGGIIAIGVQPLFLRLVSLLGGRRRLAATVFVLAGLALLIVPAFLLGDSAVATMGDFRERLASDELTVPPPPDSVAGWPIIGEKLHSLWSQASADLGQALGAAGPKLKVVAGKVLDAAASFGVGLLQLALSIIVAGLFLSRARATRDTFVSVATRIAPRYGEDMVTIAFQTVTSVVQGVLGVALIQALAGGAGMLVAGVPGTGIWTVLILILAVAQLPPLLVLGPVAAWVFTAESTPVAVAFAVWSLIISVSDSFLKPLLLGRGIDVPMPVILLGAIGGMLAHGITGLFLGATVLALTHRLAVGWVQLNPGDAEPVAGEDSPTPEPT